MQKTIGGDRLGSGSKMKVELHNFNRSTHDMSYLWRSTMSSGTLVPFMTEIALPGDTFDINLNCEIMTHPTIGPLFGSYKVQLDVFSAPIRLYNALLHNNALGIGLQMKQVLLPTITFEVPPFAPSDTVDVDNSQINPSCIMSYLGIRGIGMNNTPTMPAVRRFNAVPLLAYWEIYKQYYSNKMEEIGAVIHTPSETIVDIDDIKIFTTGTETTLPPSGSTVPAILGTQIRLYYSGTTPIPQQIIINTSTIGEKTADELTTGIWTDVVGTPSYYWAPYRQTQWGNTTLLGWRYKDITDINQGKPGITTFPLSNIDDQRIRILAHNTPGVPFDINLTPTSPLAPYSFITQSPNETPNTLSSQEGLGLKTYQSDMLNNWITTEWIDGPGGINEITAIDTSSGSFTIDTLILAKKVYDMLNRIAISGGTYDDWLDAVYTEERYKKCESPMYMGGLIRELVFQEVVSNSASAEQPLGTLAGKGIMSGKKKGGNIVIKTDEPSYIIGIVSLTPRLDYSQGNKWDIHLTSLDDLHKPGLDEIGFQDLITEQMAWWDTHYDETTGEWIQHSAGKQPAWLNYMTNINQTRGNFAINTNEMFMTLNRRYEKDDITQRIKDITTYIDPSKFNFIFAETALDAQNFWCQIAVDITARRKMSAKIMPNL